jgi:hypothetical protein
MRILKERLERTLPGGKESNSFGQVMLGVDIERVEVELYDFGPIETQWRCRVTDYDQTRSVPNRGYYTDLRSTIGEAVKVGRRDLAKLLS